ncbi:MAG: carA 1 [Burkholderiaceae bacterium]|nr:carA 1 [Burkholderiaceae bacterium]
MTTPQGYILTRDLPAIPAKRYFTIGEVSQLCDVRSYVLRYWEQEFAQLRPMKRRGNRRYYQLHEVELVRQIRALLYEQGFTIAGARLQLEQKMAEDISVFELSPPEVPHIKTLEVAETFEKNISTSPIEQDGEFPEPVSSIHIKNMGIQVVLDELRAISALLKV